MTTKHTKGPWAWQRFGKDGWMLTGQHGMRPIVLSAMTNRRTVPAHLTSLVDGLLRPLDPEHPDARLIAAAPDLLAEHEEWARQFGRALVLFLQNDHSEINRLAHEMPLDFVDCEPRLRSAAISKATNSPTKDGKDGGER